MPWLRFYHHGTFIVLSEGCPSTNFEEILPGGICGFRMWNLIRSFFHAFHFVQVANGIAA
jgi:hypothetical protein